MKSKNLFYSLSVVCLCLLLIVYVSFVDKTNPQSNINKYILPLDEAPWGNQSSRESHVAFVKVGYLLAEEFGLSFISFSGSHVFSRSSTRDPAYGLNFVSDRRLSHEEAEALASSLFNRYFEIASEDKLILDALERHNAFYKSNLALASALAFCVTFWDSDLEYQTPPAIARIQCFKSMLSIYNADPETGRLELTWNAKLDEQNLSDER